MMRRAIWSNANRRDVPSCDDLSSIGGSPNPYYIPIISLLFDTHVNIVLTLSARCTARPWRLNTYRS